tara:strand:- start:305 stop:592 length:288 start_codon:yes stop_codon:yes gene_type:complete
MTNIEFFATYIFNNPGARWKQIMLAFYIWRKWPVEASLRRKVNISYLGKGLYSSGYTGKYWAKIDHSDRNSGYIILPDGLKKVKTKIENFRGSHG